MTIRPLSLILPLLAAAAFGAPAFSQGTISQKTVRDGSFKVAGKVLAPDQQNAADDENEKDKKDKQPAGKEGNRGKDGNKDDRKKDGRGKNQDDGPPRKDAGPGPDDSGKPDKNAGRNINDKLQKKIEDNQARQDDIRQKPLESQQNQDADNARDNAIKQKKLESQQAKDIEQSKGRARQQNQDADTARDNAIKQKQLESQQGKDKARQQNQDADNARDNAIKNQQAKQPYENPIVRRAREARELNAARIKAEREKREGQKAPRNVIDLKQQRIEETKDLDRVKQGKLPPARFDRAKTDLEFDRARRDAQSNRDGGSGKPGNNEKWRDGSDRKFEALRRGRKERDYGSRSVIVEPDKRVIVRQNNRAFIRHDDSERFQKTGRELRRDRRKDGTWMIVTMGLAGALIYSLQDDDGRVLRRSRKGRDGREFVLFDNRSYYRDHSPSQFGPDRYYDTYVDLPPPEIRIPRDKYIVDYDRASPEDIYDALNAPPIERLERGYSLDEVRRSYRVLERMRRVDLDTITFEFGSWDVDPSQYGKLERIANALRRILDKSPEEMFLIEGHTDAVGSDIDNLSLSDRRAETVAVILSETFGIPPENLTTQGYGEQYLKEPTEGPSRINRRVSLRRITPLLSREGWDDNWDQSSRR